MTSPLISRGRRGTIAHPRSFWVAGVAQLTSTFVSRGRRGTNSHPPPFCVAGVALMALGGVLGLAWAPVTPRHFAWQAWHKLTSTVVLRGRRGTDGIGWRAWTGLGARDAAPLCVAGVAQPDIHLRFTWQAWLVLRGRRGTHGTGWRAWTGLGAVTPRHFAWQAWHKLTPTVVSCCFDS